VELRHLTTFQRVARLRSFTAAATDLGYAQSTVTEQIKALESVLGVELLERTNKMVRLTAAGERLLPYAERIAVLTDEARLAVKDEGTTGTVIVGSVASLATYRLSPIVEFFHHRFPDVRLVVRTSSCPDTEQALRHGELDLGLLMASRTSHLGLESVTLCDEDLVVVAAPDHPLAGRAEVTASDLREATVLNTEYGCPYRDMFEAALDESGAAKTQVLEFGTIEAIKQVAANGLGLALLPSFAVANELDEGQLVKLAWTPPFPMYSQISWRRGKRLSPALRLFVDQTIDVFCTRV
jgi:DNA-binding transcriptional LysR family regulator